MDPNTPLVLAGARFASHEDAVQAYKTLWSPQNRHKFGHLAVAVLTKDAAGELRIERHNSSTERMTWSGAVLGAALVVVAPPAGAAAIAAGGGLGAGVGGLVGYFWRALPKTKAKDLSDLLESGESGLLLVATKPEQFDVEALITNAERCVVIETKAGEFETTFADAVEQASRAKRDRSKATTAVGS